MPSKFDRLIRDLNSPDFETFEEAIQGLSELGDPRAAGPLLELLRKNAAGEIDPELLDNPDYYHDEIYEWTFETLLEFKDAAVEPVMRLLETGTLAEKRLAVQLLTEWGWQPAAPLIMTFYKQGGETDKSLAASFFGAVAYAPAVDPLLAFLQTKAGFIRSYAQQALERLQTGEDFDPGSTTVILTTIQALGSIGDRKAVPLLQSLLTGEHGSLDQIIVEALAGFKDPQTVRWLIDQLNSDDMMIIHESLIKLKQIGDPSAVEAMIPLLQHPAAVIRTEAIDGLGRMGGRSALDALRAMPRDPAPGTGLYDLPEVDNVRKNSQQMIRGLGDLLGGLTGGKSNLNDLQDRLIETMKQATGDSAVSRMALTDMFQAMGMSMPPGRGAADEGTLIQQAIEQIERRLGL